MIYMKLPPSHIAATMDLTDKILIILFLVMTKAVKRRTPMLFGSKKMLREKCKEVD